jgi:hypothetical protein
MHDVLVVENLVDLDASSGEFWIEAILQVRLAESLMLVVAFFGKDLSNVAPFYLFATISKGPWLRYIFPTSECQLFQVSKHMQPLPRNGTPPLLGPIGFFFAKLRFNLLSMTIHGYFYLSPMQSLDNSNGILISRPTQDVYNSERPSEHIYNLNIFRASVHVQRM